ncbi:hypothetical protein MUK42_12805 [Musa troglodytarum]|uniref:Uncharacterized protein n=2 Tax=Musa troglodytarum TaxID=320322 RepID=A0A9E7H1U5_9LILI|nr:hypothetical protein MUK42_12805 [Musa troglodytarum]
MHLLSSKGRQERQRTVTRIGELSTAVIGTPTKAGNDS